MCVSFFITLKALLNCLLTCIVFSEKSVVLLCSSMCNMLSLPSVCTFFFALSLILRNFIIMYLDIVSFTFLVFRLLSQTHTRTHMHTHTHTSTHFIRDSSGTHIMYLKVFPQPTKLCSYFYYIFLSMLPFDSILLPCLQLYSFIKM